MGYLVYHMEAIEELRGEDRSKIKEIETRLVNEPVKHSGYVPFFEALGRGYFKKRLEKKRLVAYRMDVHLEGKWVPVVVFLELFDRNDPSYGDGSAEYFAQRFEKLLANKEPKIKDWAAKKLQELAKVAVVEPKPLPEAVRVIHQPIISQRGTEGIFHSRLWAQQFAKLDSTHWKDLYEALVEVGDRVEKGSYSPNQVARCTFGEVEIHFAPLKNPQSNISHIFFVGFVHPELSEAEEPIWQERIKQEIERLEYEILYPFLEDEGLKEEDFNNRISRLSAYAYPYFMLGDYDEWVGMMKRSEVLLPLSFEEHSVLEKLLQGNCFPAVIEGRAGSGKTTLLTFFVPQRLVRVPPTDVDLSGASFDLLFLTQSRRLLKRAADTVDKLIGQLKAEKPDSLSSSARILREQFLTFHEFALQQLPPERRWRFSQRSREGGWIDFYHFRSLLRDPKRGLRERLSRELQNPEVIWFVLRSYIKGFNLGVEKDERWMTPEQYASGEDIGNKDRQVSVEVFEEVWHKVWPWYKRLTVPCPENDFHPEFWDDIDLAWEVLDHRGESAPSYAVIVCDEVQDLSRVELAAVLQSLEQLRYRIRPEEVRQIPVIFAGDSHQTINPSCFRWARLTADCGKALVRQVPDAECPSIEPFELCFNYRNRPSIARLCNAIQFFRQEILKVREKLQHIWVPEDDPYNQAVKTLIVAPGDSILAQLFRKGVLFVGPEPVDVQDPQGRAFWKEIGFPEGPPERQAYETPVDLKGLEKDYVALLGFGTAFRLLDIPQFREWDGRMPLNELTERDRFALEYFLNRLYVAASRAREELWIVETKSGWKAFWEPFKKWLEAQKESRPFLSSGGDLATKSAGGEGVPFDLTWVEGKPEDIIKVFDNKFGELAKEYLDRAIQDSRNPEDAERAAYYWKRAGDVISERKARAWQLYLQGEKSKAAGLMWEVDPSQAGDWWWEAADWQELAGREVSPTWRRLVAQRMIQIASSPRKSRILELETLFRQRGDYVDKDRRRSPEAWLTWSQILTEIVEGAGASDFTRQEREQIVDLARRYEHEAFKDPVRFHKAMAQLYFFLDRFEDAVGHWEEVNDKGHRDYFLAKARITPFPACLAFYESAQDWDAIVREDELNRDKRLSVEDYRRVFRACLEKGRLRRAVEVAAAIGDREFSSRWALLIEDERVGDLRSLVRAARATLENAIRSELEASSEKTDEFEERLRAEVNSRWSFLILDTLQFVYERSTRFERFGNERTWYPLLDALSLGNNPDAVAGRFQTIWERRSELPERWAQAAQLLDHLVDFALVLLEEKWRLKYVRAVANLTHLIVGLVWGVAREDTPEGRKRRVYDDMLGGHFDVVSPRVYVRSSNFGGEARFDRTDFAQEFLGVVRKALEAVAEAPPGLLRSASGPDYRDFRDLLDGIGYGLLKHVQLVARTGQSRPTPDQEDWWKLAGKFVRRLPFRKLAVAFFNELKKIHENLGTSQEFERYIREGLREAQKDLDEFRDRSREWRLGPGEWREDGDLLVRSLPNRPEIIIEVLPSYDQLRFAIEDKTGEATLSRPRSVEVDRTGRDGRARWWQFRSPAGKLIRIVWEEGERQVRVEGEATFWVTLAEWRRGAEQ